MKTLKYLLPVVFFASCVSNKEVYDDVYTKVVVEKPVEVNEDLGYADYIENNKEAYNVEVDSSGIFWANQNDRSANNSRDVYITNYNRGGRYYDPYFGYGWDRPQRYYNSWGWTNRSFYSYNQWYVNPYFSNSYYGFGYWSDWAYDPWNSSNGYWGYSNWGCGYNPFYNGWYNDPFCDHVWLNNNCYNNNWNNNNWSNNNWNSNNWNNNNWNNGNSSGGSNYFYGHRGSISSGSPNTTNYLSTVKAPLVADNGKPFVAYSDEQAVVTSGLGVVKTDNTLKTGVTKLANQKLDGSEIGVERNLGSGNNQGGIINGSGTTEVTTTTREWNPVSTTEVISSNGTVGTTGIVKTSTGTTDVKTTNVAANNQFSTNNSGIKTTSTSGTTTTYQENNYNRTTQNGQTYNNNNNSGSGTSSATSNQSNRTTYVRNSGSSTSSGTSSSSESSSSSGATTTTSTSNESRGTTYNTSNSPNNSGGSTYQNGSSSSRSSSSGSSGSSGSGSSRSSSSGGSGSGGGSGSPRR